MAELTGLRMATKYTIEVTPKTREDREDLGFFKPQRDQGARSMKTSINNLLIRTKDCKY